MRICPVAAILAGLTVPGLAMEASPQTIRVLVQMQGAATVVQSLDSGPDGNTPWDSLLSHIEAGEAEWIALAPLLAPGTDAGTAEGLIITLSRALRTNPAAVLTVLAEGYFRPEDICVDNDIKAPWSDEVEFLDDALYAVASVLEPLLLPARNACLIQLGAARVAALK